MISRRFRVIAQQEFYAQLKNPLWWVLVATVALLVSSVTPVGFIPSGDAGVGNTVPYHNSQHALAANIALCTFFAYPFFACLMAGLSVIRDDDHQFSELLYSTPVSTREYLFGKWAGVMAALGIALTVHLSLLLAFRELPALAGSTPAHGPFVPLNYFVPWLLIAIPAVYFVATVAFVVGAYTRRPMAVYAVPVAFFVGTLMFTWTWAPAGLPPTIDTLLAVLDPTGLRWVQRVLFANDQGLAYYNNAPITFGVVFWTGRLLTLALPASLMVLLSRDKIAYSAERSVGAPLFIGVRAFLTRKKDAAPLSSPTQHTARFDPITTLVMRVRAPGFVRGLGTILAAELRELRRQPALWGFLVLLMFVVVEAGASGDDAAGAPILLSSGVFAVRAIPAVTVLVCLYLLFAVVELMYRDVATRFDAIGHAAPVSDASVIAGRGLALVVLIALSLTACFTASALQLSIQGSGALDLWPLVLVFGAVLTPTFLLWVSFLMAVVSAVRQRTTALAIGIAALTATGVLFLSGEITWINNWPLWGALRWSDLGVFPLNGTPLLWNRVGALTLTAFFAALTVRTFSRVDRDPLRTEQRRSMRELLRSASRLAPFTLAPLMIAGFLSIRIDAGFQGDSTTARQERHFTDNVARWTGAPTAHITALRARIELEPARSRANVTGTYLMRNNSADTIPDLVFTVSNALRGVSWTVAGVAAATVTRDYLQRVTPSKPLAPGDSIDVGFAYTMSQPVGVTRNGGGARAFIVPAGVLLSTRDGSLLPVPGFVDLRLNPLTDVAVTSRGFNEGEAYTSRVEVQAPSEYIVNSVGTRTREETRAGRTTVVWESDTPIASLNLIAGRWNQRSRDGSTVFFHKVHDRNVDVMLNAMTSARTNYSLWFGSYPWRDLRLSELPDLETNATAFPTNISMSEGMGFLAGGDAVNGLAFSVVAHEVAHQWWGHLIKAAAEAGDGLMIEGMANYATLLLHEREHGAEGRMAYALQMERAYTAARRPSSERGILSTSEGDPGGETVLSHRGALVLWMLRDVIGAERTDSVVKVFAESRMRLRDDAKPRALLALLRLAAPDSEVFDRFIEQWMDGAALPEFDVRVVSSAQRGGRWLTELTIGNIGSGVADVEVELRSFENGNSRLDENRSTTRERVQLVAGQRRTVVMQSDFAPRSVLLDPDVRILQRNRERARASVGASNRFGAQGAIGGQP